jgi:hypothetical protein
VVQTTAASQPLLLVHEGANYWFGSGASGNFVSTPNAAANQITGDIDFIGNVKVLNTTSVQWVVSKMVNAASQSAYGFGVSASGGFIMHLSLSGSTTTFNSSTATGAIIANVATWVRVTRVASSGDIEFFTSIQPLNTPLANIVWVKLGATVSSTSGNIFNSTANVTIGARSSGTSEMLTGNVNYAHISNLIGGTPTQIFNPNQYNAATSQTQFTSSTGEIWSIQTGTAATGYKGVLVDRTIVQGDGVDDVLFTGTINVTQPRTNYASIRSYITAADTIFFDGNNFPPYQNLLRQYSGGVLEMNSNGSVSMTSSSKINKLVTSIINSSSSTIRVNNGTVTTSSITGATLVALRLFRSGLGQYGMSSLQSFILSKASDNTSEQTAMYDYIKSINNNAF